MELLDFLERLAPFSTPDLILRDDQPRFAQDAAPVMSDTRSVRRSRPSPPLSKDRQQQARRRVLRTILLTGGVLGAALSGYLPLVYAQKQRLRPPGALDEKDFLSSCIKCGQCVQVCPVQAIKLADLIDGFGVGTPYIDARAQACDFSCDAVQCILACPTGSLTYHKPDFLPVRPGAALAAKPILLAKEKDAEPTLNLAERIGVARLTRPGILPRHPGQGLQGAGARPRVRGQAALHGGRPLEADQGRRPPLRRRAVRPVRQDCPIKGAISIETVFAPDGSQRKSPVVHEPCVGCGVCEMICPTEPTSIEVIAGEGWRA